MAKIVNTTIPLSEVRLSKKAVQKLRRDRGQIDLLRRNYEAGISDVPVLLTPYEGGGYTIIDGRHRVLAALAADVGFVDAKIVIS